MQTFCRSPGISALMRRGSTGSCSQMDCTWSRSVSARKGQGTGEQLITDDAQREDIAARIEGRIGAGLFRGEVIRRAHDFAVQGEARFVAGEVQRQAEIE